MVELFNPMAVYQKGVNINEMAYDTASKMGNTLNKMYNMAVDELGFTQKEMKNNKDAQYEVAKLMFSDKYAGNASINPLLKESPYYKGFNTNLYENEKQNFHQIALGINYNNLVSTIKRNGSFDSMSASQIIQKVIVEPHIEHSVENYLSFVVGTSLEEQRKNYAALLKQDPNIGNVKPELLETEELKDMAKESIMGKIKREDLEDMVGLELPKYNWMRNAA
jgi:hypothetical protein